MENSASEDSSGGSFDDVAVLGAGPAGLTAALAFPGCTVIGPDTPFPPYNLDLYEPLASFLGTPATERWEGYFWVAGEPYTAPLQLSWKGGYYTSALSNSWRRPQDEWDFRLNNVVWGKSGDAITDYAMKKIAGYNRDDHSSSQLLPVDLWRPPDPGERSLQLFRRDGTLRPLNTEADYAKRSIMEKLTEQKTSFLRSNVQYVMPTDAEGIEVATEGVSHNCQFVVSTIPFPIFRNIYGQPFDVSMLQHSSLVVANIRAPEEDHHHDVFSDENILAQRVTHHEDNHVMEIVVPSGFKPGPEQLNEMANEALEQLLNLEALLTPAAVDDVNYTPFGYPYMTRESAEYFEIYNRGMNNNCIYQVGRWSQWKPLRTSHVFQEARKVAAEIAELV